MYTGNELREMFLTYFRNKGHTPRPSASLIPQDDPTLLLTVAGMVPFKPYFTRRVEPPFLRATTCQKCVRTPDLEIVGKTARHHTFFEMLGNFSFGDYFKKDAIQWAWEYVTVLLKLPPAQLWVTIHPDDEEARQLWIDTGVSEDRIHRDATNFWAAGPTGPCGPCSEIYVDLGLERGCGSPECAVGCECDRFLEIWNLVFMQYDRDEEGTLTPLPKQNIDTGMGLERITAVMQGVTTNFDTDLFRPIIAQIEGLSGIPYRQVGPESSAEERAINLAMKVVADHSRAVTFMLGDGIRPSSDGRGYVLRRILRRAVRYARLLGIKEPFFERLFAVIKENYAHHYPELQDNEMFILNHLRLEEKNFQATLEQGMILLQDQIDRLRAAGKAVLDGAEAFHLYETYGFPVELTEEILREEGLAVDLEAFEEAAQQHRQLAKEGSRLSAEAAAGTPAAAETIIASGVWQAKAQEWGPTPFTGYTQTTGEAVIRALLLEGREETTAEKGDRAYCLLSGTPFYAESGGQVSDRGKLITSEAEAVVFDVKRLENGLILHGIQVVQGVLRVGATVSAQVDEAARQAVARHHSATHLLHAALRQTLGAHVQQAGSLVTPDRLRFDFSHFAAVTREELITIENLVNAQVLANWTVTTEEMSLAEAKVQNAVALFGEKYGERVRVVKIEAASAELCGGTHVGATGQIGLVKIVVEGGIGAGLRRIEAVAGAESLRYLRQLEQQEQSLAEILKTQPQELVKKAGQIIQLVKDQEHEVQRLTDALSKYQIDSVLGKVQNVDGVQVIAARVQAGDMDALRRSADLARDKLKEGVVVLGAVSEGKVNLVAIVHPTGLKGLHAGKIIKDVAAITGGGGGGRPDMAQAGGKDPARLGEALGKVPDIVRAFLK